MSPGEDASSEGRPAPWKENGTISSAPLNPVAPGCDSPSSSPERSRSETKMNGHSQANGHHHHHHAPSGGDVNDNFADKNVRHSTTAAPPASNPSSALLNGSPSKPERNNPPLHPLFHFGVCRWPGCETPCEDLHSFNQ